MSKNKNKNNIVIFTDGSCISNGNKNSIGGIGIHFPNKELNDISKLVDSPCTNQSCELYAILIALRYINKYLGLKNYNLTIKTDSKYCIDSITKWVYGWLKNGWKTKNGTSVLNKDLIEIIHKYYEKYKIIFYHVEAHTGLDDDDSIGNAFADKLATMATKKCLGEKKNINTTKKKYINKKIKVNENNEDNENIIVELIKRK